MNIIFKPECKTEIIEPTYDLPVIGEPISKTGASANNSNAYGVIVGIIGDGSSRRVRVMTEGYIDYDKVKENYMEYTDEAINALTGITLCSGGKLPTGVQPDWNQNDETAADYVKNRPFYTGDPVETVLVEESTVSFVANGGKYMGELQSTFSATVGDTYQVSWDGTVYESACINFSGRTTIGNLSLTGSGPDTGEPFVMNVENGKRIKIGTADTSASHTISISGFCSEVVKIDEKYLPKVFIVNVVGEEPNLGNIYLLFDKTDEEIYNAMNNGIPVTLKYKGYNIQCVKDSEIMFWGFVPYTIDSNGITKLKVLHVSRASMGWLLKSTYIEANALAQ